MKFKDGMESTNISNSMKTQTSLSLPLVTVEIKATLSYQRP